MTTTSMRRHHPVIPRHLVVWGMFSLLLHSLLLLVTTHPADDSATYPTLSIKLITTASDNKDAAEILRKNPAPKTNTLQRNKPTAPVLPNRITKSPVETLPPDSTNNKRPADISTPSEIITANKTFHRQVEETRRRLEEAISRQLRYPYLASYRGWQGVVLLKMRLEIDGRISDVHVTQTSGYKVLDEDAVDTLYRVGQLKHNLHQAITINTPVVYRLKEG